MPKQGFLRGALVLALAGAASRVMGVFYAAVLPRVLSGEGYGLYTAAKPVYHALLILAVAGLPVAIAQLVANRLGVGDVNEVRRVFRVSMSVVLVTGTLTSTLLVVYAEKLACLALGIPEASLLLRVMAPALLLVTLASALRGYLQGLQRMTPVAVSQVAEQVVRVAGTVLFAILLTPFGQAQGAAGAMLGAVAGGAAALIVLSVYCLGSRRSIQAELTQRARPWPVARRKGTLLRLAALAFPLVVGQILWPAFEFLDTVYVPSRLMAAGLSRGDAMTSLGYLGMAGQLMWVPNVFTLALSASLVPAIAEGWAQGNMRSVQRYVRETTRFACILGLPASTGLFLLSEQITWLLFGRVEAGASLAALALGTLAIGIQQVTAGALQGLGKAGLSVRNLLGGVVVKWVCNAVLLGIPALGVCGAAVGTVLGVSTAALLNCLAIRRFVGLSMGVTSWLLRPLVGIVALTISVLLTYQAVTLGLKQKIVALWLSPSTVNAIAILLTIGMGTLAYGAAMLRTGGIRRSDVEAIPYCGMYCAALLARGGWLA